MESKLNKFVEKRKIYDKEGAKQANRNRLKESIKKKMTTILVGCIDEIEQAYGEIWAHGTHNEDKTDEQLDETALWNKCRDKMFDRGNGQIRNALNEIDSYDVELIRVESVFNKVKGNLKG